MGLVAEQGAGDNAAPLSVSELSSMLRRVVEDAADGGGEKGHEGRRGTDKGIIPTNA